MVKVKNKKRNLAENVSVKKVQIQKKKLNPFEIHINKEKIKVLGRKLKNDKGLPGVSRAKALQKRKSTLLPEYEVRHKSNKFTDKRIGERNGALSAEDKNMARYAAVRMKQHKKAIYNLADDEVLTHAGQTLSEIEKFDDPRSDNEDEDDERMNNTGSLQSKFVEEAHFGGGMLKKTNGEMSHKELIDQLIAESKIRKAEKQKQKEATLDLTEKLDTEWKDLLPLVNNSQRKNFEEPKKTLDEYDKVMRELRFEARGTPSDKLKTEDEIAREEKEKLEKLEQERLNRMHGILPTTTQTVNHRSADDLDDNFAYESDDADPALAYNEEGDATIKPIVEIINGTKNDEEYYKSSEDENGDEEEGDGEEGEDEESDTKENPEDDLSDFRNSSEESDGEDDNNEIINTKENNHSPTDESSNKIREELLKRKEMMEAARKELPYTYPLPENYEALQALFANQPAHHQSVILERIIKCNHPSLKEGNKEALGLLFVYLLQHINDLAVASKDASSIKHCVEIFKCILNQFYELAELNPGYTHKAMIEVIKEKQGDYKKRKNKFPSLEVLLYLKLVSALFSTSDYKHMVVTPCFVFIEQMLTTCRVRSKCDIAYGLFLVNLIAEYTALSKRYLPAAVKFLNGVFFLALPKTPILILKVLPPFKSTSSLLVLNEETNDISSTKMDINDLINNNLDNGFKIKALSLALKLMRVFFDNFSELPSRFEIFEKSLEYIQLLPPDYYPEVVKQDLNSTIKLYEDGLASRNIEYVVMEKKKPKALRLYEPSFDKVYDGKKYKVQSKEKTERDKLLYKLKKERKGAIREIRRDKSFIGRVKINQQIKSDTERKEKVKRIYSEAAIQQSELNEMDRKRKRKK